MSMKELKLETRGSEYFVPVQPGSKGGTLSHTKNQAGFWLHVRKRTGDRPIPRAWAGKYPIVTRTLWVKAKCPCCGQMTDKKRVLSKDSGVRARLEFLRRKYKPKTTKE